MLPQFRKSESETPSTQATPPSQPQSASSLGGRPTATFRAVTQGTASVIGPDLLIEGNLTSKGEVQIEGEVQGDVRGTNVVVGEKARVTGSIIAEECILRGHVLGTVRGRRVLLQATCHVEGDIYHQTLAIEQGAFFEGKSRRTDDPIAGMDAAKRQTSPASPSSGGPALAPAARPVEFPSSSMSPTPSFGSV